MSQGVWVLLVALVAASGFGLWRAAHDGRFRGTRAVAAPPGPGESAMTPAEAGAGTGPGAGGAGPLHGVDRARGERATLLQFSSAFCAPCRATRRVLGEVADLVPGVVHIELDAEDHLDLVRELGISRTPTTLVLDAAGHEVKRAAGAPSRDAVLASLAAVAGDVR